MKPKLASWETIKKEYPDRFVLLENPVFDPTPYLKEAILLYKHKDQKKVVEKIIELKPYYSTIAYTGAFTKTALRPAEPEMVFVQGGTFMMGATPELGDDFLDIEKPVHKVTLSDFYIGKYEITQAQWKAVMGDNPSHIKGENLPVERVSWDKVQVFIQILNTLTGKLYRLPTEAEWEFAARGGNKSKKYKYSGSNVLSDVSWYMGNSGKRSHPVGTKSPNELDIYDMSGNVWEWCNDRYGEYSSNSKTNPQGPVSGSYRVCRGGSWNSDAYNKRVSYRDFNWPDRCYYNLGFRLACSSKQVCQGQALSRQEQSQATPSF